MKNPAFDLASPNVSARAAGVVGAFGRDFVDGLRGRPRSVPSKHLYDRAGSLLFDRICELPEYYQTRTETKILRAHGVSITEEIGADVELIEFGAGSLAKVRLLLDAFDPAQMPARYVPIDISGEHLDAAAGQLREEYPALPVRPLIADYTDLFVVPMTRARRAGFFPGSTIGNFGPDESLDFLRTAARLLQGGGLLIGVDLVKDPARLHAAYNDAQGVTADFNLNLLARANRELGADFDTDGFFHHAFYNAAFRRIEMHLVSRRAQTVDVLGERFAFDEGDTIHTENSYKYTVEGFRKLAVRAGFAPGPVWIDSERLFSVHWLNAPARPGKP